jgi:hypothetical protein
MPKLLELYLGNCEDYYIKEDYINLFDETIKEFDKTLLKRVMKLEYEAETLGEKYKNIKQYEKELKEKKQELVSKEHNNGYCFITINPPDDVSLKVFKTAVEKLVARNIYTESIYVYEQRGTSSEDMGKGRHCHLLCKRNLMYKPSKVAELTKNTLKNIVDVKNPALLNIQHIGEEYAKDKIEYITGEKTGDGKDQKQEIDIPWRESEGLESFYGSVLL